MLTLGLRSWGHHPSLNAPVSGLETDGWGERRAGGKKAGRRERGSRKGHVEEGEIGGKIGWETKGGRG